jgi:phenylacetate-coenzyme A ligase PaaK-like adenylate-forming protein
MEEWRSSVQVTEEVLRAHGVACGSKVLITHPFAPWAIGQVFAEAAIACGAHVFPIGLYFLDANFHDIITEIDFTHICSTARSMIRWKRMLRSAAETVSSPALKKIFVAGEKLTADLRFECESIWNASVIDIYGMAEFDTVAAELIGAEGLVLSPYLIYKLRVNNTVSALSEGACGELLIKRPSQETWHETGDMISVLSCANKSIWRACFQIKFVNRMEEGLSLSDGSSIRAWQVQELLSKFQTIRRIQIRVRRSNFGDKLEILYQTDVKGSLPELDGEVLEQLVSTSIDLQDCLMHKTVSELNCRKVDNEDQFFSSLRGKIPMFTELVD